MIKNAISCLARIFFFSLIFFNVSAAGLRVKKDLSSDWMVYAEDRYHPYEGQSVRTIYFTVNASGFPGDYLRIGSSGKCTLFINGKLAGEGQEFLLSLDSLAKTYTSPMLIGLYRHEQGKDQLITQIRSPLPSGTAVEIEMRKSSAFRDFTVVASLILTLLLIVVIRLNPKLASDYFSVTRIFSTYEGEDAQLYTRITSSVNILFYVFCSLMLGYYMMIVFQFVQDRYPLALLFQADSFSMAMLQWIKFSAVLLVLFFLKIILVYFLASLFGLPGIAGVHFFNWVRLLLVIFGIATIVLSFYFIVRGQHESFFVVLFRFLSWALAGWTILILFKLRGRTERSLFHLFSYICATELIPFLFIIKILYN